MNIDIGSVKTREDYLLQTALLSMSIRSFDALQAHTIKSGILSDDEMDIAKTIRFELMRLFTVIDDQVNAVTSHTGQDWDDVIKSVINVLSKQVEK